MNFDYSKIALPVVEIVPAVINSLSKINTLLVNAPPGAGKSTVLPLALLDEPWLHGKKIIMLEPRRLAARTIAQRMSVLLDQSLGKTVGYRIRFETRISAETKLEVVTEGILTRMLQADNALEEAGMVIFDEFHERSLHADVALALCREAQQVLRPDLRILIMSATLNMPALSTVLKCPVIVSEGKQFPVEIIYSQDADERMLPEFVSRAVISATEKHEGDVLVFLPGEAEIRKTEDLLNNALQGFSIHPLYGQLPPAAQQQAILPDRSGRRKIVLATSIAETSLTIEGIKIVVDSGFARRSKFDPKSGLSKLETVRISKDSADQRAGRAGRLSAGKCIRLWSAATHSRLAENRTAEILEADLTDLLLDLAQWGIIDPGQLTWLTPPPKASLAQASDTLHQIDALENNRITVHGRELHKLACHPRIAHMLLLAEEKEQKQLGTDVAAVLEERDVLSREAGIDINLRVEALRRWRKNNTGGGRFSRIEKVAENYRRMLGIEVENGVFDPHETGLLLAHAYPERIAFARPGNNAQYQLANGRYAAFAHQDDLAHEPWLAVAHLDLREGSGKIFLASPLNPSDLKSLVKEKTVVTWDTKKGGLIANKELRIGSIVLQAKPLTNISTEEKIKAICSALKTEGSQLLNFDDAMVQLQNRISSLRKWNPEMDWPDVSSSALLETVESWLSPYLNEIKKTEDLKKIDLSSALLHSLDHELQKQLEKLAPARLEVPTGSKINITYFANGDTPVLAVRLQEVFGLRETPAVNNGKTKVVMHLLSPGYKPVQVTSDLKSFWNNLYFEVKKELQRRYPKHSWPDDPWTAPPVAKGRSQKR